VRRPSLLIIALALALVMALPSAAAAAPKKKRTCASPGSTIVVRTSKARIFAKRKRGSVRYYGCLWQYKRKVFLSTERLTNPTFRGPRLAWSENPPSAPTAAVGMADLAAGKAVRGPATTAGGATGRVTDMLLDSTGNLLWVYFDPETPANSQVHAMLGGSDRLLDQGASLQATSLTLQRAGPFTVGASWLKGGLRATTIF